MRRPVRACLLALMTVAVAAVAVVAQAGGRGALTLPVGPVPARVLEVFHGSPLLVRAGEDVRVPVDVVCATVEGDACPAVASLRVGEAGAPMRRAAGEATPNVEFDVSAAAGRSVRGPVVSGSVRFQVSAHDATGRTTFLTQTDSPPPPLRLYVTRHMPTVQLPRVRFGRTVRGERVLFLPWGTGPLRAGLRPGNESPTLGPSSFDVAPGGSVVLVDAMQGRVAEFRQGALVRSVPLRGNPWADVAVGHTGSLVLANSVGESGWVGQVRTIDPDGLTRIVSSSVPGKPSEIRRSGDHLFVRLLPEDGWVPAATVDDGRLALRTGRPLGNGRELVVAGTADRVRVGFVSGGRVHRAIELTSATRLGSVQLAEPDGSGGIWIVVHAARDGANPADRYQVIHVTRDRSLTSFTTPSGGYAESMALSRFRLGPDGAIYQMRTAADGVGIYRYEPRGSR
jgi:hypothetical protein